jgi:Bifunctional DNA primase/polymerase, N-terminal
MPRVSGTPSGGIHLHFVGTDQRNGSLPKEHLDFRSSGGYVLAPPSRLVTDTYAGAYWWERRRRADGTHGWTGRPCGSTCGLRLLWHRYV